MLRIGIFPRRYRPIVNATTVTAMIIIESVDEGNASIMDTMTKKLLTHRRRRRRHVSLHIVTNQMTTSLLASIGVT